ncbi:hypothetical protein N7450_000276 [Penicillium hetheringtonii]|uniref:Uncharacterized protein n=1 Tax=Penicillium hetheringtonii TaxID=911720 RepID=A0AAD6E1Y0_9EURO|nr:hypothetical protein N7450_000276 [Penicillium hetheringtonii]
MPDMQAVFQHAGSPPKLDLANANPQLFQLPSATSASSSLYSLSVSRKRPRRETPSTLSSKFDPPSEVNENISPLISTDFRHSSNDGYHASAELDYRPNRYRESFLPPSLDASVDSLIADDSRNSRKRSRRDSNIALPTTDLSSPSTRVSWGRTVINAVGKVLDLCWSGAFRGFYAGGGQGYDMSSSSSTQFVSSWHASPSPSAEKERLFQTPIPGQYPDENIDRGWVVVPTEPADPFHQSGSDNNNSTDSPSALRTRRIHQASSPRRRQAVMPRLAKRQNLSVRPSTPTRNTGLPSPRSQNGPGSAEMQKYAARIRRKEREEDASIQRLNKQLQDMIRQGKEALGTTVEVDDLDMDLDFQSD